MLKGRIMKKICILLALVFAMSALSAVPALAEKPEPRLPFELKAPTGAALIPVQNTPDNACSIIYGMDGALVEFLEKSEGEIADIFSRLGYDGFTIAAQMDWSIDSESDWHENEYWLSEGLDENGELRVGEWAYLELPAEPQSINAGWVFGYLGNPDDSLDIDWYGTDTAQGWNAMLSEGQYIPVEGSPGVCLDLEQHTVYARVRWIVRMIENVDDDTFIHSIVSDWSPIASIGRDADAYTPYTAETMPVPDISELAVSAEKLNGIPVVSFVLNVPDKLANDFAVIDYAGGSVVLTAEARVGDGEWKSVQLEKLWVENGRLNAYLVNEPKDAVISKDMQVELRAGYSVRQFDPETMEFINEFDTPYSNAISSNGADTPGGTDPTNDPAPSASPQPGGQGNEKSGCRLCGICPIQPFGICLFVWIGIIVLLIVGAVIGFSIDRKNKKRRR